MKDHTIIRRLQDFSITNVLNSSSQNAIANSLLAFIFTETLTDYTLEDLAYYCNASNATLSRFIRDLGFSNYKDFKQAIISYQTTETEATCFEDFSISSYREQITNNIFETARLLEQQDLSALVQAICQHDSVHFLGIHYTEMLLKELQYNLLKIGKKIYWAEGYMAQREVLQTIEPGSVCIFLSHSGRYLQSILPFVLQTKKDFKTYLVTSKDNDKFQTFFDHTIYIGNDSSSSSKTYQLQFFTDVLFKNIQKEMENNQDQYEDTTQ